MIVPFDVELQNCIDDIALIDTAVFEDIGQSHIGIKITHALVAEVLNRVAMYETSVRGDLEMLCLGQSHDDVYKSRHLKIAAYLDEYDFATAASLLGEIATEIQV